MVPFVSGNRHGVWQVDRQRLIRWLETSEQEVAEEQERHQHLNRCCNRSMMSKKRFAAFVRNSAPEGVPIHQAGR
jgi:hypothetical protein